MITACPLYTFCRRLSTYVLGRRALCPIDGFQTYKNWLEKLPRQFL